MREVRWWWLAGAMATVIGCGDSTPGTTPQPDAAGDTAGDTSTPKDMTPPPDMPVQPDADMPDMMVTPDADDAAVTPDADDAAVTPDADDAMVTPDADDAMVTPDADDAMVTPDADPDAASCTNPMETRCGSSCVNTATDNTNCGSCGNACMTGQSCSGGMCMTTMPCMTGQTMCGASCVDTNTDASNCGRCGNACGMGQVCRMGTCAASVDCSMMPGTTACAGTCVNTMTDAANCGMCGRACPMGEVCTAGTCGAMPCGTGQTRCGSTCTNTMTDNANCGMCGRACATGQTCTAGTCTGGMMGCMAPQVMCGSTCTNTQTDNANCGMCGRACATGQTCTAGMCVTARMCPMGQTDCAPMAPMPMCVNLQTSNTNCGACGTTCPTGTACTMGACACTTAGQTLCGRTCVNAQTDNNNCGTCGTRCAGGQTCTAGRCACPTGQTSCGGACVNTQTNNNNCGTCGTVCAGGTACTGGRCVCPMGQTSCGTPAACVNTQTDRANCGACGRACTVTGQTCTNGMCACPTGTSVCGSGAAAACVNLMTSATNCGMCGRACPMGQSCMGGMCRGTPPANDTRAGATLINLASPSQTLMADTTFARNDVTGSCRCTSGNDVWFRFVLTAPEVVYADTLGSTPDTALFLTDSNGTALSNAGTNVVCNDDASMAGLCAGISGLQSQIVARLAAGTYYLVLSGCSAGASSIRFQHLPAGNGTSTRITPSAMSQTVTGTTSGTGTVANSCCSAGPENSAFWITCPGTAATTFQATSCSASTGANAANFDNAISVYSALRTGGAFNVCNDDVGSGFVCNAGSSVGATIPATAANQAGLNVMILDSCIGVGNYSVRYVLANCTSGTRCGAACVDTNFDENNCGGCDRRCPSGNVCSGGVCYAPPSNDTRASATAISLAASQVVLSANNAAATANQANTGGACTCTNGRDVFYSFTLTRREVVYADTIGSARDTSLFFLNAAGTYISTPVGPNARTCNDDGGLTGCATGTQSQVMTVLDAGTYYLVLSGCGEGGPATIRFQHLPVGNGPVAALGASVMGGSIVNGTTAGTGTISGACCSSGPENTYLWYTCQGAMAGAFTASTCGRATWDTSLSQRSAARTTPGVEVCQDDAGGTCGTRSNISSTIPAGPGIHALYVDGCLNQSGMYSVLYTRP